MKKTNKRVHTFVCKAGVFAIFSLFLAYGCKHADGRRKEEVKETDSIKIKSIKVNNKEYTKQVTTESSAVLISVETESAYEGLKIEIGGESASVTGNKAEHNYNLPKKKLNEITVKVSAGNKEEIKNIQIYYKSVSVITEITVDGSAQILEELNDTKLIITRELMPVVTVKTSGKFEKIEAEQFTQTMDGYKKNAVLTFKENLTADKEIPVSISVTTEGDEPRLIRFKLKRPKQQIVLENVKLNNSPVQKDSIEETQNSQAELILSFKEAYRGLAVTVNGNIANIAGSVASYSFALNPGNNPIAVKANADEADEINFNFTIRYTQPASQEIITESVTLNDIPVVENEVNIVRKTSGKIEVKLQKEYEGINVKVNEMPANQTYAHTKIFDYTLDNLTGAETPVKIVIAANGKTSKEINFKVKYEAEQRIVSKVEAWEENGSGWTDIKYRTPENAFKEMLYALAFTKMKVTIEPGTKDFSKFKMKITREENNSDYINNAVFKLENEKYFCEIDKLETLKDNQEVVFKLELFYDNAPDAVETQKIILTGQSGGGSNEP